MPKKKKKKPKLIPPRGPASQLRPGGPHDDKRRKFLNELTRISAEEGWYD